MPRALLTIPLAHGLDTKLDERLRAPEHLSLLTNGIINNGAAKKRRGFTKLATTVQGETGRPDNQGPVKGLLSDGVNLMIRGYRSLYAYDAVDTNWRNHGVISPCVIASQQSIWHDQRGIYSADSGVAGNYLGHLAVTARQKSITTATTQIDYTVSFTCETKDKHAILTDTTIAGPSEGGTTDHDFSGARVVGLSDRFKLFYQETRPTAQLRIYGYTPNGSVPALAISETTLKQDGVKQMRRTHDACALGTTSYAYAFCDTADNVTVRTKTNADGVIATATLVPPGPEQSDLCAIHYDAASSMIFIAMATFSNVYVYRLNATTLATDWGPVSLATVSGTKILRGLGLAFHTDTAGANRLICVMTFNETGVTDSSARVCSVDNLRVDVMSCRAETGADLSTVHSIFNCHAASKPWLERNRCYLAVNSDVESDGFGGACVLDLNINAAVEPQHTVAAAYNFGTSPGGSGSLIGTNDYSEQGSLQSVIETSSGSRKYRFVTLTNAFKIKDQKQRLAADLLELDFLKAPLSQVTSRGAACLGGGNVCWHAGSVTEELGWYSPPMITGNSATVTTNNGFTETTAAAGVLTAGVTYQYQPVIETYDEKGNLLRSVPGPARSWTLGATMKAIFVTVRVDALTSRRSVRQWGCVLYRAAADGIFYRAAAPLHIVKDSDVTYRGFFRVFDDLGTVGTTASPSLPIYTQGGAEVEAAGPDGAQIVMVGSQRVWLAGFGRRDRLQYSKLYNPGSANEDSIGPEFNDAFVMIIPRGNTCSGIAELDDKVIVFTETEIYVVAGNGPDDGGRNNDFSGLTPITADAGCVDARSVVVFPGGILFQGKAGIYLLGRDLQVQFIGKPVQESTDTYTEITSAVLVPKANQVRFTARTGTTAIVLVYDYYVGAWSRWEPRKTGPLLLDIVGACMHGDVYHALESDGTVWKEDSATWKDDTTVFVPMTIETAWLQVQQGQSGFSPQQSAWHRTRSLTALCARKDPHDLKISLYQDFETAATQTNTWTEAVIATMPQPAVREQVEMHVTRQKSTAFRARIEDVSSAGTSTGEGYTCAGFTVELSGKRGKVKVGSQQRN